MPRLRHESYQKLYNLTVIKEIVRFDDIGEEINTDYTDLVDNEGYTDLSDIVKDLKGHYLSYWSEDPPWDFSSLRSDSEENFENGNREYISAFIQRGEPGERIGLTFADLRYLHRKLKVLGRSPEREG